MGFRIEKKQILVLIVSILFVFAFFAFVERKSNNILVIASFIVVGIISVLLFALSCKDSTFSCKTFHYLFCLFFFFIAPFNQYCQNSWPLVYTPSNELIIRANTYICIWELVFYFGFKTRTFRFKRKMTKDYKKKEIYIPSKLTLLIFLVISFAFVLWMITRVGFITLVASRNGGENVFEGESQSISLLLTYFVRNFITFTALFSLYRFKQKKDCFFSLIVSMVLLLIGCSPAGMPRFQVATIYIAVLVLIWPQLPKKTIFLFCFIFAFLFVFPLLDLFRTTEFWLVDFGSSIPKIFSNTVDYYLTGNFDAYVMLIKTLDYCNSVGLTLGHQLFGTLLFFVPRSIWPNKALSTATIVQNHFGFYDVQANVSSSFLSEEYIDFGLFGIIVYSAILSKFCRYIDERLNELVIDRIFSITDVLWILTPTLFFFMMRGSLMSTFAFAVSFYVVGILMISVIKLGKNKQSIFLDNDTEHLYE